MAENSPRHPLDLPPLYFLAAMVLILSIDRYGPALDSLDPPWAEFGWVLIFAGIALALWAERLFARAKTGVRPFTPSTSLVATGPYRWTRNPMYLGMVLVLAGVVVRLDTLGGLPIVPLFWFLIDRRFVRPEEDHLERAFGQRYLTFKAKTRRWL